MPKLKEFIGANDDDAGMHADILAGTHEAALNVTRKLLREDGWSDDEIEAWMDKEADDDLAD